MQNSDSPIKFSILLMTYNAEEDILLTLQSIEKSCKEICYNLFELVAVDDFSSDSTYLKLRKFLETTTLPLKLHRNTKNFGLTNNLAHSFTLCSGIYTVFMGQSDLMTPDIKKAFEFISNYISVSGIYPSCFFFPCRNPLGYIIGKPKNGIYSTYQDFVASNTGEQLAVIHTKSAIMHSPTNRKKKYIPHSILFAKITSLFTPLVVCSWIKPRTYIMHSKGFTISTYNNKDHDFGLLIHYLLLLFYRFPVYIKRAPFCSIIAFCNFIRISIRSPASFLESFKFFNQYFF